MVANRNASRVLKVKNIMPGDMSDISIKRIMSRVSFLKSDMSDPQGFMLHLHQPHGIKK